MFSHIPYRICRKLLQFAATGLLFPAIAIASTNSGITYHGRILMPDGATPVSDSAVQFKMQILTPDSQNCVMYEEIQMKDLTTSYGAFSITINDGSGTPTSYGYTLDQVFGNYGTFHLSPAVCTTGTGTWTPNVSDGRAFLVSFKTSSMSSWEPLPTQAINFAPFAIEAKQIAGFPGNTLLRVEDATTGPSAIRSLTTGEAAELLNIVDGNSTNYIRSTSTGASLPSFATNPASPVAGDIWYDSANNEVKYYDGTTVQVVGGSSGSAITSGTIGGSTAVNTSGNIQTSGNVIGSNVSSTTDSTTALKIYDSTVTNAVTITAPASLVAGGYPLVLPNNKASAAGQVLTSDTSGNLSWTSLGSGATGYYQNGGNSFSTAATLGTNDSNALSFKTNGSTAMTISTAQNVGVGTASPDSQIHIQGAQPTGTKSATALGSRMYGQLNVDSTDVYSNQLGGRIIFSGVFQSSGGHATYGAIQGYKNSNSDGEATGGLQFLTADQTNAILTNRMTINSSGSVGIGTTSPAGKFEIHAATNQNLYVVQDGNSYDAGAVSLVATNDANTTNVPLYMSASRYHFDGGNVGIGTASPSYSLDVTGNIRATSAMYATGFYYTSDQRLKENIETIENPIDKITALRGVNFQWKETKQQDMGFIAQEVEQVLPEVMGTRPDKTYGEIKTVKYANIVALAVEAIKDLYSKWQGDHRDLASLKAEVDQLKADNQTKNQQIEALEKRLEKLESQQH